MAELKERTYLRGIALQALYEYDLSGHEISAILMNRFEPIEISDDEKKFVIDLVTGVLNHKETIDGMIKQYAKDWPRRCNYSCAWSSDCWLLVRLQCSAFQEKRLNFTTE